MFTILVSNFRFQNFYDPAVDRFHCRLKVCRREDDKWKKFEKVSVASTRETLNRNLVLTEKSEVGKVSKL